MWQRWRSGWTRAVLGVAIVITAWTLATWFTPRRSPRAGRQLAAVTLVGGYVVWTMSATRRRPVSTDSEPMSDKRIEDVFVARASVARPELDESRIERRAEDTLVAYASQTGTAEDLARRTADTLRSRGRSVRLASLADIDETMLRSTPRLLCIASTAGDGDPPDDGAVFAQRVMTDPLSLPHLSFGVLALGDSTYDQYCAFGRALDRWLRASGATAMFECIDVDDGDPAAIARWDGEVAGGSVDAGSSGM